MRVQSSILTLGLNVPFFHLPIMAMGMVALVVSTASARNQLINVEDGIGIKGYDPVAYFEGEAIEGNPSIFTDFDDVRYHFSTNERKKQFLLSPKTFLPQFGGYCAYAMLEGEKVDVDPKAFKVVNQKLYLFYDGFFGDTLKKWNHLLLEQPEAELIRRADSQWKSLNHAEFD